MVILMLFRDTYLANYAANYAGATIGGLAAHSTTLLPWGLPPLEPRGLLALSVFMAIEHVQWFIVHGAWLEDSE